MTICWFGIYGEGKILSIYNSNMAIPASTKEKVSRMPSLVWGKFSVSLATSERVNSLCRSHYRCMVLKLAVAPVLPSPIREELCQPANQQQWETRCGWGGAGKALSYQTEWSDPRMNGQSSLILSAEGKKGDSQKGSVKDSKCGQHGN